MHLSESAPGPKPDVLAVNTVLGAEPHWWVALQRIGLEQEILRGPGLVGTDGR